MEKGYQTPMTFEWLLQNTFFRSRWSDKWFIPSYIMFSIMFSFFLTLTHIAVFDKHLSSSSVQQKENIYLFLWDEPREGEDLSVVCLTSVCSVRVHLAVFRVCGVGAERGSRRLLRVCGRGMKNVYKPNHGYCHCSAFISSSLFLFHSNEALRNFSHNIEVQDDVLLHDTVVVVVVLRCDFLPLNWRRTPCQICPCFRYSKSRQDLHPCDSFLFWCWLYRFCSAQVVD